MLNNAPKIFKGFETFEWRHICQVVKPKRNAYRSYFQGTITEGEGTEHLTSSVRQFI